LICLEISLGTFGSVASLLAAHFYLGNHNQKIVLPLL